MDNNSLAAFTPWFYTRSLRLRAVNGEVMGEVVM